MPASQHPELHPRFASAPLRRALSDSPVVLVHGPRQSGKTTLVRTVAEPLGYRYLTLDDDVVRNAAERDSMGFVAELKGPTILDEVQRTPSIFGAMKASVDRDRTPGRFLLTGSTNLLLLPKLSDSLAGRLAILRLFPLTQSELTGTNTGFVERLLSNELPAGRRDRLGPELARRIVAGGFPAALARNGARRRATWYRDYVETIVQRDVRDLARISSLDALPRLLELAAGQTARMLNVSDLAAPFQVSRPTIRDYITLLARVFLLEELPPWHSNRLNRLVKSPKLHIVDTGIACSLLGYDADGLHEDRERLGQLFETFVYQELRRQASWLDDDLRFHHFRDRDGTEVDLVIERGARTLVGVEAKAGATVTSADFRGMRMLAKAAGKRFVAGVIVYDGEHCVGFGDRLRAVPVSMLWQPA
ncbi:MAG: ATP-binding protein [Planctomycetes bacterium]|nr:ATP-binding protein [Planctomycetota bacterium]